MWQENGPREDGNYDSAVFVARYRKPPRRLWRGTSIGPSNLAVVHAQGKDWALYMPGRSAADPRLAAVVEPLTRDTM